MGIVRLLKICRWLIVSLLLLPGMPRADEISIRSYFIDEPVFNGQAWLVEAGRRDRPLIVLVHGLGDRAAATWQRFIPLLAREHHVIAFDLPGFGHSSKANRLYSPDNYVAFIHHVVKRTGKSSFKLVGHSMGANIALRYATTYPQQVERLLLVDAAGLLHRMAYVQFLTHFGIQILPEFYTGQQQDLTLLTETVFGSLSENPDLIELGERLILTQETLRASLLGGDPATIAAYAMIMTDYSRLLSDMKVPTLIVWGKQDAVTPIRTGKLLAGSLPNAGMIVFESSGHNPMDEAAQRFGKLLRRFSGLNQPEFADFLADYRYRLQRKADWSSEKVYECHHEQGHVLEGDYQHIILDHCQDIILRNFRAAHISIRNSQVTLENCYVRNSGKAMSVKDSDVVITSCEIEGQPAVDVVASKMDVAGVRFISSEQAFMNSQLKSSEGDDLTGRSMLMFSASSLTSRYLQKALHYPLILQPGEGL